MSRLFDIIVVIIIGFVARAILRGVMKDFTKAAGTAFQQSQQQQPQQPPQQQRQPPEKIAGELHKDPVCGMYVAESTQYQRRSGHETFYYCSDACKDKHAVTARA